MFGSCLSFVLFFFLSFLLLCFSSLILCVCVCVCVCVCMRACVLFLSVQKMKELTMTRREYCREKLSGNTFGKHFTNRSEINVIDKLSNG